MSLEAKNEVEKRVLEYVLTHASADLMERISAEGKTIQGCWAYVTSYAKAHANNNQYCMTDEEEFGLVMHYFEDETEGAEYKTEKQKQDEENARISAANRAAEEKRKEEERIAALTPEEREAEEHAKAEATAKAEALEAERRKKEFERKIREQAKAAAAKRKAELANAQMSFNF